MTKPKIILLTALGALCVPLFAASAAQADTAACSFSGAAGPLQDIDTDGAGPLDYENGVKSLVTDAQQGDEGDSTGQPAVLTDTDNGNGAAADGTYSFASNTASCLLDDTDAMGSPDGLYVGSISSSGSYDNSECGTGTAADGASGFTDVTTSATGTRVGGTETITITDTDYTIAFTAGQGPIDVTNVAATGATVSETAGDTDGAVSIQPDGVGGDGGGDNCVNADVNRFLASGSFTVG